MEENTKKKKKTQQKTVKRVEVVALEGKETNDVFVMSLNIIWLLKNVKLDKIKINQEKPTMAYPYCRTLCQG